MMQEIGLILQLLSQNHRSLKLLLFLQGRNFDFNNIAAKKAPTLPPAPTIPETEPIAFLLIKGTTENVAPSAM